MHTSGEAEAAGVCAALSWALSLPSGVPFRVHTDCDWARCQAAGLWGQGAKQVKGSAFFISRQLTLLHQALQRDFDLLPVRSHIGHPWNDLADAAARHVTAAGTSLVSPLAAAWSRVLQSEVAPWLWLLPGSRWHSALPTVWALAVEPPAPDPPSADSCIRQFEQVLDLPREASVKEQLILSCSFASFNATTLRPSVEDLGACQAATRIQGVQALLQQQFHAHDLLFVGIQETRVPASTSYQSGHFAVLSASADEAGQGGVALWVNTHIPYAKDSNGRDLFLLRKHCVALYADPRRLFVKVCAPGINVLVCVWHAPHSMRPEDDRVRWWQDSERHLRSFVKPDDDIVLLIDANARVGSVPSTAVGSNGCEKETHNGTLFREFLEAWHLILPATFSGHEGQHWTWTSPHGTHARIDYVAIPQAWSEVVDLSSVLLDVEHAQLRDDHLPVVVRTKGSRSCAILFDKTTGLRCPDPNLSTVWSSGLAGARLEPWSTAVDDHAFRVLRAHQRLMRKCSVNRASKPRQPFLAESTLQLVRFRKHLRRSVRALSEDCAQQDLRCLFAMWQGAVFKWRDHDSPQDAVVTGLNLRLACAVRALQLTAREIQQCVRVDKVQYLHSVALKFQHAAEDGDVQALYRSLRCFRPNGGKRRRLHPLAGVAGLDGQPLGSATAIARRWSEHFGFIEGGGVGTVEELVNTYASAHAAPSVPPRLEELPTLQDWEATFVGLKSTKSPGPGGLSAAFVNQVGPPLLLTRSPCL